MPSDDADDDTCRLAAAVLKTAQTMVERRGWNFLQPPERDSSGATWFVENTGDRALVVTANIARACCATPTSPAPDPTRVVFASLVRPPSSCGRARIGKRQVDQLMSEIDARGLRSIVFVTDELATPTARGDFRSSGRIEYFHASELARDPARSAIGMPTYRLVKNGDEIAKLFSRWHAKPTHFPVVDLSDPVCRYYACGRGSVFEITDPATGVVRYRMAAAKK